MHLGAFLTAQLFFNHLHVHLLPPSDGSHFNIVDLGSQDVNGNMRDALSLSPFSSRPHTYLGVDMVEGANVDHVLNDTLQPWTFLDKPANIIITCSTFEHDIFFWQTFLHMTEALTEGGFMLTILPKTIIEHRYPTDNWRFQRDSSEALAQWARYNGHDLFVVYNEIVSTEVINNLIVEDIVAVYWKQPSRCRADASSCIPLDRIRAIFESLSRDISNSLDAMKRFNMLTGNHKVTGMDDTHRTRGIQTIISEGIAHEIMCVKLALFEQREIFRYSDSTVAFPHRLRYTNGDHVGFEFPFSMTYCSVSIRIMYDDEDLATDESFERAIEVVINELNAENLIKESDKKSFRGLLSSREQLLDGLLNTNSKA